MADWNPIQDSPETEYQNVKGNFDTTSSNESKKNTAKIVEEITKMKAKDAEQKMQVQDGFVSR